MDDNKKEKESSFNLYNKDLEDLFATVVNLSQNLDIEDENFVACMEFFKFMNLSTVDIKDKSTGRGHKISSTEAVDIFGTHYAQLLYQVLNKMTASCTSKFILAAILVFSYPK